MKQYQQTQFRTLPLPRPRASSRPPPKAPSPALSLSANTTGSPGLASTTPPSSGLVPTSSLSLSSSPSVQSTPVQNPRGLGAKLQPNTQRDFNVRAPVKTAFGSRSLYTDADLNRTEEIFSCLNGINDNNNGNRDSEGLIQSLWELYSLTSSSQNVRKFLYTKSDKIYTLLSIAFENRTVPDILSLDCGILWNIAADFNNKKTFTQNDSLLDALIEVIGIPNQRQDVIDIVLGFLSTLSADKLTCKVLIDKEILPKAMTTFLSFRNTVPTITESSIKLFYNVVTADHAKSTDTISKNKAFMSEVTNSIITLPTSEPIVYYGCALLTLILQRADPSVAQGILHGKEASFTKSLGIMLDTFVRAEYYAHSTPLAVFGLISVLAVKVVNFPNAFFIAKIHEKIFGAFNEVANENQKSENFVFFGLVALCGMCYKYHEGHIALANKEDIKTIVSFLKLFANDREIVCHTVSLLLMISNVGHAKDLILNDLENCVALLLNIVDKYGGFDQVTTNGTVALIEKLLETNSSITSLNLSGIGMKDKSATILFKSLEHNRSIQTLDIRSNDITDTSAIHLLTVLHTNTTLINLSIDPSKISSKVYLVIKDFIRRNYFMIASNDWGAHIFLTNQRNFSSASVNFISEFISRRTCGCKVLSLDLSNNNMGYSEICSLSPGLTANNSILKLNLAYNSIKDEGAKICADVLRKNTSITNLDLTSGEITDIGANYIADALAGNTSLRSLDLSKNPISEEGFKFLSEALKRNKTLIQMGLDPEFLKTSRTGKTISKQLKDNSGKLAKSGLLALFIHGAIEDVLWTLCTADLCWWLEDLGCTQDTLRYIAENDVNGEMLFSSNQKDLYEGEICSDDLQKIYSAVPSGESTGTVPQAVHSRPKSNPATSESSGSGCGSNEGSGSGYSRGSSSSNSDGSALSVSDEFLGGYGTEIRELLPLIDNEKVNSELPEIEMALSECDAFVQSEVLKNPSMLKFIADTKLTKNEVYLLSLLRGNCVVLDSAQKKMSFRDYITSKENDIFEQNADSRLIKMVHDSVAKLQNMCGVAYIQFCEEIDRRNTFDEGRVVQPKKILWATRSLEKAKASVKFPRVIIKAQVVLAKDFTPFSGKAPSDGCTTVIPHTAKFVVSRGLYLEQDGFSYIDLVETTQDQLNRMFGN